MSDFSHFRIQALNCIRQIPAGQIATYGQIARLAGSPRAARQIGRILYALKAHEYAIPWQRVINSQGQLSTWAVGNGELQLALLQAEGIVFDHENRCDLKLFQWPGPD